MARLNDCQKTVYYDWEWHEGTQVPAGPQWLRALFGDDFFSEVDSITFNDGRKLATDADLALLDDIKGVKRLCLYRSPITDNGLSHCAHLTSLEALYLGYCVRITDNGLSYLENLQKLVVLDLSLTKTTDLGLTHLSELTQLRELFLSSTEVTDLGVRQIAGLTELRVLDLKSTRVSDAAAPWLGRLRKLERLRLDFTKVSDAGFVDLQKRLPRCDIRR